MKYIAYCDSDEFKNENRSVAPSASNVVKYMADVFGESEAVEIISPSRTLNNFGVFKGRRVKLLNNVDIIQPPTVGVKSKIGRVLILSYTQIWLFMNLLFGTHRGEKLVVYHSLSYMNIIRLIKKIKKLKITLEIREIYSDINNVTEKKRVEEKEYFQIADSYIFATNVLNKTINTSNKPYIVISGIYKPEKQFFDSFDDNRIHLVYAGTLRKEKGGAQSALKIAENLSEKYTLHILGYGSEKDIDYINDNIDQINKKNKCRVSYDGILYGDEFKRFIQKCDIGLAVQKMEGEFNNTSFPSKILTYLANGLDVLSTEISVVVDSDVGCLVHYCKTDDPVEMAERISEVHIDRTKDNRESLRCLDKKVRETIKFFFDN